MTNDAIVTLKHRERIVLANRIGSVASLFLVTIILVSAISDLAADSFKGVLDTLLFVSIGALVWATYARFRYIWDEDDTSLERYANVAGYYYTPSSNLILPEASVLATGSNNNYRVVESVSGTLSNYPFSLAALQSNELFHNNRSMKKFYSLMTIDLPKELPHIVLDTSGNNKFFVSSLPAEVDSSHEIELEGNFSQMFKVYARREYANDALDILSPDFMETLLSLPKLADIEVIGNKVLIYIHSGALTAKEVESLLQIGETLAASLEAKMKVWELSQDKVEPLTSYPGGVNLQIIAGARAVFSDPVALSVVTGLLLVLLLDLLQTGFSLGRLVFVFLGLIMLFFTYGLVHLRFWSH